MAELPDALAPRSNHAGISPASGPDDPWGTPGGQGASGARSGPAGNMSGQPAGMVPRTAATVIDAVIVGIAWFVAIWLFLELLTITGAFDPTTFQSSAIGDMMLTSQPVSYTHLTLPTTERV